MAGPIATVAADVRHELEGLRTLTVKLDSLEKRIPGAVKNLGKLTEKVNGLSDKASPELISAMAKKLARVQRAADAVLQHVKSKRTHTPHQYWISLSEVAEYLHDKLDEAIPYFRDVERRNPSALLRSDPGQVISVPIERGNDSSTRFAG